MKILKGDTIEVRTGKDAGKRGKVLAAMPKTGRLTVESINIRKKHSRPRRAGEKGQIVEFPASLPASRVMLVCPACQKTIRVAYRTPEGGAKERFCRKCGAVIPTVKPV
jgi:large subunit ribosomal protein L24